MLCGPDPIPVKDRGSPGVPAPQVTCVQSPGNGSSHIFGMKCGACTFGLTRALGSPCNRIYKQRRSQLLNGKLPWPMGYHVTRPWPLAHPESEGGEWWARLKHIQESDICSSQPYRSWIEGAVREPLEKKGRRVRRRGETSAGQTTESWTPPPTSPPPHPDSPIGPPAHLFPRQDCQAEQACS